MNYRFYNAKILTMKTTDIMEGELWVQDDKILYVGEGGYAAAVCQSLSDRKSVCMEKVCLYV